MDNYDDDIFMDDEDLFHQQFMEKTTLFDD